MTHYQITNNTIVHIRKSSFESTAGSPSHISTVPTEGTAVESRACSERWLQLVREDICGYDSLIGTIVDGIRQVLDNQALYSRCGLWGNHGYLLHGLPGTGKSRLAISLATHSGLPYFIVHCPQIFGASQGSSEAALTTNFEAARAVSPSIIVLDDIDALSPAPGTENTLVERRVLVHLLELLDALEFQSHVFVLATSSRLQALDPGLRSGSRFQSEIHLKAMSAQERYQVLRKYCKDFPIVHPSHHGPMDPSSLERERVLMRIAEKAIGYVGADLQGVCREVALGSLGRQRQLLKGSQVTAVKETDLFVTEDDFLSVLSQRRPANLSSLASQWAPVPSSITFDNIRGLDRVIARMKVNPRDLSLVLLHYDQEGISCTLARRHSYIPYKHDLTAPTAQRLVIAGKTPAQAQREARLGIVPPSGITRAYIYI